MKKWLGVNTRYKTCRVLWFLYLYSFVHHFFSFDNFSLVNPPLVIAAAVIAPPASSSATPFDTRSDTHYTRFRALTYK